MFNPSEDEALGRWFQRLSAPLKCLPPQEQAELHLEVRQHLESLAAAHEELGSHPQEAWELAMVQFGDPAKIGRRLRREAMTLPQDPNRWAANPLMAAGLYSFVMFSLGVAFVWAIAMATLCLLWGGTPTLPESSLCYSAVRVLSGAAVLASAAVAGWLAGSRMKKSAVGGTFCALSSLGGPVVLLLFFADHDVSGAAWALAWISLGCFSAWAAERQRSRKLLSYKLA